MALLHELDAHGVDEGGLTGAGDAGDTDAERLACHRLDTLQELVRQFAVGGLD